MKLCFIQGIYCFWLYNLPSVTACTLVSTTRFTLITIVCAFVDSHVLISLVSRVVLSVKMNIIAVLEECIKKKITAK